MPGEEDGNNFEGHSLQFKDSLGKTSLWSVLVFEAVRLHGGSSNAVFWRKEFLSPIQKPDGLVCLVILILQKPSRSFLEKIQAVGETLRSCSKETCSGTISGLLGPWTSRLGLVSGT